MPIPGHGVVETVRTQLWLVPLPITPWVGCLLRSLVLSGSLRAAGGFLWERSLSVNKELLMYQLSLQEAVLHPISTFPNSH